MASVATIPRTPVIQFVFDPDGTANIVDVSCYVIATDISQTAPTIGIPTYCEPSATELGVVTSAITVAMLWSEAMFLALQPHIGEEFELRIKANSGDAKDIVARCRYAHVPWGRIEPGVRMEQDLVLAVLSAPDYVTVT